MIELYLTLSVVDDGQLGQESEVDREDRDAFALLVCGEECASSAQPKVNEVLDRSVLSAGRYYLAHPSMPPSRRGYATWSLICTPSPLTRTITNDFVCSIAAIKTGLWLRPNDSDDFYLVQVDFARVRVVASTSLWHWLPLCRMFDVNHPPAIPVPAMSAAPRVSLC
eukprot:2474827-Rhodomonas_salina.1